MKVFSPPRRAQSLASIRRDCARMAAIAATLGNIAEVLEATAAEEAGATAAKPGRQARRRAIAARRQFVQELQVELLPAVPGEGLPPELKELSEMELLEAATTSLAGPSKKQRQMAARAVGVRQRRVEEAEAAWSHGRPPEVAAFLAHLASTSDEDVLRFEHILARG